MTRESEMHPHTEALLNAPEGGWETARSQLIERCCSRLYQLTHRMLRQQYPGVGRWEDTNDVVQAAMLRLYRALATVRPKSARHFYQLATKLIRWELIELLRRYFGPEGIGNNLDSVSDLVQQQVATPTEDASPETLAEWTEFHEAAGNLPDEEREIFDLLWYQELSQKQAASLLGVSVETVKRRWQRAKIMLYHSMHGQRPG